MAPTASSRIHLCTVIAALGGLLLFGCGDSSRGGRTADAGPGPTEATGGTGGATGGTGGATGGTDGATGGTDGATGGATGTACTQGSWPAADPSLPGPFAVTTELNVGPPAGVGADGGPPPAFTLYRPTDMAQGGLCHPVVTWGNGTGSSPSLYRTLLTRLASHGFVVIASDSPNVAQGNPAPMLAGVTWVLEQNADPASVLYQRIDTAHVGATGHSQGGFATTAVAGDARITTIAPICGAGAQRNLHGPALLLCGTNDTYVPCSSIEAVYNNISSQPAMLAEYLSGDHGNWITFFGNTVTPLEVVVVAWMRVHLMGDTALRPRFYGASCALCQDAAWQITKKMMDQ